MNKIVGVELSHRFAPLAVREKLALNKEQTIKALHYLKDFYEEVFIISTCNRLSIYAYGPSCQDILNFFDTFGNYRQYLSILPETEIAVRNLFSTAAGLESQAIGEHQILGQIKDALDLARQEKTIGPVTDELIRIAIHIGKQVRLETNIGKYSASLATVGFELIEKHGYDLPNTEILVIGTGNMANLVTTVLDRTNVKRLYIASHNKERAEDMAREWGGEAVDIKNIHEPLAKSGIIIGGTQGEINLLSEEEMGNSKCPRATLALKTGSEKLFIDFGVPRNFNPELKKHPNIHLYDLDDIKKITYEGLLKRYDEIPKARKLVNEEVNWYLEWLKNRKVAPVIQAYWSNLEQIKEEELKWLLPKLGDLTEHQIDVINRFVHRLLRKISKPPIESLKEISQNLEEVDNPINTAKKILDVDINISIPKKTFIVGTRGSKLALTQSNWVIEQLKKIAPQYNFETKIIKTSGDQGNIDVVGAFTSAIQRAMLAGEVDLAIHSFKDLPTEDVNGLRVIPVTKRENHRDAFISKSGLSFRQLPKGSIIGTGSLRRIAQMKALRNDLEYKFIQGNVDSRLHKLHTEEYDAIVLASAGLYRLNMQDVITHEFTDNDMLPAVGQGILAIETIDKEGELMEIIKQLRHLPTKYAADAERAFLIALGGGCNQPMACYAQVEDETIHITGFLANDEQGIYERASMSGLVKDRRVLAGRLAQFLQGKVQSKLNAIVKS
jgi:hydroxymethylbilane synthase